MSISNNYIRAISEGRTTVRKRKHINSPVLIRFLPYYNERNLKVTPDPVLVKTSEPIDLCSIDGITLERVKNSTLEAAVAAGRLEFVR